MKHFLQLFTATAFALCIGCADNSTDNEELPQLQPPPQPVSNMQVNIDNAESKTLDAEADNETMTLEIISQSSWTLSISDTRASSWLSADKTSGEGNDKVTLTLSENLDKSDRTAKIHLANASGKSEITLTQKSYGPSNLKATPTDIDTDFAAKSLLLELSSDIKWEIESSDQSICVPSPIRGEAGKANIKLAITENTSNNARQATLTVRSGYDAIRITINQARKKPVLNFDKGIRTLNDLCRFRDAVNEGGDLSEWKYNGEINLLDDIDLSYVENWEPIGTVERTGFTGTFNGNGFTISNVTIHYNSSATGFFGWNYGIIKNLNLEHVDIRNNSISGKKHATGGIAGYSCTNDNGNGGKIKNCSVSGFIFADCSSASITNGVGGICGYMNPESDGLSDCTNRAIILTTNGYSHAIAVGDNIDIQACKNEGLNSEALPYKLFKQLISKEVLKKEVYYSKQEIFDEIDNYNNSDGISLDLEGFGMTDPQIIERFKKIRNLYIQGNTFESLNLSDKNINYFSSGNIKELNLSGNPLSSLNRFTTNNVLTFLDVSGTGLKELDLSNSTNLKTVIARNTKLKTITNTAYVSGATIDASESEQLKKLDVYNMNATFEGCPALKYLSARTSTTDFSAYPLLDTLIVSSSGLSSIDITRNPELKYLDCSGNNLKTLDIDNNRKLEYVSCSHNQLSELNATACPDLKELYCGKQTSTLTLQIPEHFSDIWAQLRNNVPTWSYLTNYNVLLKSELNITDNAFKSYLTDNGIFFESDAKRVTKLDLSGKSDIKSLAGIEYFTSLDTLITPWSVSEVDLSKNTRLKYLNTSAKIDPTILPELEYLFYETEATTVDLSKNVKLKKLRLFVRGQFKTIDLSSLTELEELIFTPEMSPLESIDVSKNIKLKKLSIMDSSISTIDLSKNTELEILNCQSWEDNNSRLTALDVSKNTALEHLDCSYNQLTSLDVSNCPVKLSSPYYYYNQSKADGYIPLVLTVSKKQYEEAQPYIEEYTEYKITLEVK